MRIRRIKERDKEHDKQLANGIVKLIYTKHASLEQIRIMGEYYGVDVETVLNYLELDER